MKKILLTWELGGELGHLAQLSALARALGERGHRVTLALRDLAQAHRFFADTDAVLLQAPVWLPRMSMQRPITCLADTLQLQGYLETATLHSLVRAWRALIDMVAPDLIACDYSPTALIAARGIAVPRIVIGTGFAEPPPGRPIAVWRQGPDAAALAARQETRVVRTINSVLERERLPAIAALSDLYTAAATFITTFPELDVYAGQRRDATYCVPHAAAATLPPALWPDSPAPRILAYVKPDYPYLAAVLNALSRSGACVFVVCPGADPALLQPFVSTGFAFTNAVVDLKTALEAAACFVAHGAGALAQSLLAGKPVLALPMQQEQLLAGTKIQALGLGKVLARIDSSEQVGAAIAELLAEPRYRAEAHSFCERHEPMRGVCASAQIAARCETLTAGNDSAGRGC